MSLTEVPIGKDCVLVYGDPTDWDTPNWTEITEAVDVSMSGITKTSVDVPSRGTQGWNLKAAGLKSFDLTFGYLCRRGADAVLEDLRDSYFDDKPFMFAALDGPSAGDSELDVQGFRFIGMVIEFPLDEQLEDARRVEIKVEPVRYRESGGSLVLPEWYVIEASEEEPPSQG